MFLGLFQKKNNQMSGAGKSGGGETNSASGPSGSKGLAIRWRKRIVLGFYL